MLRCIHVVSDGTTMHAVHTCTVAFKLEIRNMLENLRNQCKWDKFIPLTRRGFTRNGVLATGTTAGDRMNGTMTGVVLDGMKTVNKHIHICRLIFT